jgi:hypothetical protein
VVDVCGTSLVDATTYMEDAFESVAFAAAPAPERNELLTPPLTKRFGFANQKDPEEVRRETHELFHSKLELIEELALINMLEQPAAEKKAPLKCDHGRPKSQCRDCGTGHCVHGCRKSQCKDCGTGHCMHGRPKSKCKDCGTGYCLHGRRKGCCRDCGTGHCVHRRRKGRCKDCGTGYCQHGRQNGRCNDCRQ